MEKIYCHNCRARANLLYWMKISQCAEIVRLSHLSVKIHWVISVGAPGFSSVELYFFEE